ncbi:hypothetical protein HV072_11720 [Citrobacter sp. RHBSTW-00107]|nr:hypothetical protein HV302_11675 [Citrobacter sp. RHBSTW-00859]QLZ78288.1 hypothetical protein HV072_11720 [Citrobacter sp. RHBSTW-00107]
MADLNNEKKTINKTHSARFPAPPFPQQKQPFPGLAGKMQPRPDHGEESYQGSGRLNGRKVLITGGDSGIGRAGNDSNLLIVFYVQIMPDDLVMQLHRF